MYDFGTNCCIVYAEWTIPFIYNSVMQALGGVLSTLPTIAAMQFYGENLRDTYGFARRFAGSNGRIVTLPELISARAHLPFSHQVWQTYYTTASSEYFYAPRRGAKVVIVAHGDSPMHDINGIRKAYGRNKNQFTGHGLITRRQFRKLENGAFGDVTIVDFKKVERLYSNGWIEYATLEQAAKDPLLQARCGADWQRLLEKLCAETERTIFDNATDIRTIKSDVPFEYFHSSAAGSRPFAHLLSAGTTCNMHAHNQQFVSFDVRTQDDSDGKRFIGVQPGGTLEDLHKGPELLRDNIEQFVLPHTRATPLPRMVQVEQFESGWFSCVPKVGRTADTGWPEHPVVSITPVGPASKITCNSSHYLRYDITEVIWGAPSEANAYYLGEPRRITTSDGCAGIEAPVFYAKVEIDTTRICPPKHKLKDFDAQMSLLERHSHPL